MATETSRTVEITPTESWGHGLRAVHLAVDLSGTPLDATKFPSLKRYLSLSGPPGGPLGLSVEPYAGAASAAGLSSWLESERAGAEGVVHAKAALAGEERIAVAFFAGTGHARALHAAFVLPLRSRGGLVIDAFVAAGGLATASLADVLSEESLARALGTLTFSE